MRALLERELFRCPSHARGQHLAQSTHLHARGRGVYRWDNAPPIWRAKVLRCALRRRQAWIPKAWFKKLSPCEVMHRLSSMAIGKPLVPGHRLRPLHQLRTAMHGAFACLAFTVWTMAIASGPEQRPVQGPTAPLVPGSVREAAIMFPKYKSGPINGDKVGSKRPSERKR